jgi:MFS family permease
MLGAAHKPGAIPLRPLTLGEMYDGAFRIIRFNPKATVGSAVLVAAVTMMLPVVVTAILTWTVGATFDATGDDASTDDLAGQLGSFAALGLGAVLQIFGLLLVTGMIVHVTSAAAVGRRLSLEQAWAATRGKRWRLIGLSLLLWGMALAMIAAYVVGLVLAFALVDVLPAALFTVGWSIAFLAALFWFWIRVYYLPVPALMLEPIGVTQAIGRGFRLTRRQFWRTFGIALLTYLIAQIGGSMLALPVNLVGQVVILAIDPAYALLGLVVLQALVSVISAAFVAPFSAAVGSLQYIDQRMRKEAFDVELMTQAGLTAR